MNNIIIPFGWRKVEDNEIQLNTDWWINLYGTLSWRMNGTNKAVGRTHTDFVENYYGAPNTTTIRQVDLRVNSDPNIVTKIVDNPNEVSNNDHNIPIGWRQVKDGEVQEGNEWYFCRMHWYKNATKWKGYIIGDMEHCSGNGFVHIRKISDDVIVKTDNIHNQLIETINSYSENYEKVIAENINLKKEVERLSGELVSVKQRNNELSDKLNNMTIERDTLKFEKTKFVNTIKSFIR